MLGQAFGNIIKNAAEAIEARLADDPAAEGHLLVRAAQEGGGIVVDIVDNGKGLPRENRHRLLEPYMTTREKGTGLGLAIVKKIVEDHHGTLSLRDADESFHGGRGALIRMTFPMAAPKHEDISAMPAGRGEELINENTREMSEELNHGI
jgi:two-component system, NtrC family, nitrogen regulation sensor histidine kinase NtrY